MKVVTFANCWFEEGVDRDVPVEIRVFTDHGIVFFHDGLVHFDPLTSKKQRADSIRSHRRHGWFEV